MANRQIKLVVVGDGACGKTCALQVYKDGKFPSNYVPTVFETYNTTISLTGGDEINCQLFDTAGQDDYERLRPLSYPNTNVFVVLYDVASPTSLENVEHKWLPEINHFGPEVPKFLVGNKTDLRDDPMIIARLNKIGQKPVTSEEARQLAIRMKMNGCEEISAMNGINVNAAFNKAVGIGYMHANNKPVPSLGGNGKKQKKDNKCNLL